MNELLDELRSVHRETARRHIAAGEGRTVVLRRTYDAPIDDVWNAITTKERIERWFAPVSGDLKLGGRYQVEGNAGGEIVACDRPRLLRVTWVSGEEPTERDIGVVEVRLATDGERTVLELEHAAVVEEEFWARFGPGAVGVGWDLALLGLVHHLAGVDLDDRANWDSTSEAREFMTRSSEAWGDALRTAGTPEHIAADMVRNTTSFYVPDAEGS